ncbi:MAG TPA: rRNA adenine N-6-methyltransferase family protein [Acidimicrobiales bacterium]
MSESLRARWGWHQLSSPWARRVVADADLRPGDLVLDLGAGTGALTEELVRVGARVIAVELHPARYHELRRQLQGKNAIAVRADIRELRLPRRPFHVVANPPFSATAAVLRRLVAPGSRLVRADLVVPRHVVRRWTGGRAPGDGRWSWEFEAAAGRAVPRGAFRPPAPHDAMVLCIVRRP